MSLHAYTRCWVHLVWSTLNHYPAIDRSQSPKIAHYLKDYAKSKNIYILTDFVNPDHVHCLIDLPSNLAIDETVKLLKGASSHWINENRLVKGHFNWQRGYGGFSVSPSVSVLDKVVAYINAQGEHHRIHTFEEEYEKLIVGYGLQFRKE